MVLEIKNLNKFFGEGQAKVHALKEISFAVNQGEFILIVGSSGSGKSTLLNMIGLLDKPTSGNVVIDGIDSEDQGDNELSSIRNKKIGFIFQFSNLLTDLTVLENVVLPRQILGDTLDMYKDSMELLRIVGMEEQMDKRVNKISGGQAQRVAIARGLINKPSIILADEPTGNLDSVSALNVVKLMKSMAKKYNQTFIIVTHDRHQFGDADRVITVKDGKILDGALAEEMEVLT